MNKAKLFEQVLLRCQKSPSFFIENFCVVKHPKAGVIPFKLFSYQKKSLLSFRQNRFTIYKKTRQCFDGSSMVWTPTGPKRIDSIERGDLVYSYNESTRLLEIMPVLERHDNGIVDCVELRTKTGHRSIVTLDHEILTHGTEQVYKRVCDLTVSDRLVEVCNCCERLVHESDTKGAFESTTPVGPRRVYDLTVAPHHNYVVDGVVVHNCGISTLSGAYALWYAMFYSHKTVLIVSKTDRDATAFLDKNIKFVYSRLPSEFHEVYGELNRISNEHSIKFPNGSTITSLPSAPDVLRSNSASLNIIDEAGFMRDMDAMWSSGFSTMMHGGASIVISTCVDGDSLVRTRNGLERINKFFNDYKKFDEQYDVCDVSVDVATDDGIRKCSSLYRHKKSECLMLTTKYSNSIICEKNHAIRVFDGEYVWKNAINISKSHYIPIVAGNGTWDGSDILNYTNGPDRNNGSFLNINHIDNELAYLLGVILAEGYQNKNYTVVANGDREILDRFLNYRNIKWIPEHKRGNTHIRCLSKRFADFLIWFGFKRVKAPFKVIPERILTCSPSIMRSFISGMFDGDGFSRTRDGMVGYVSTSLEMIKTLQQMLLSFGIFSNIEYKDAYIKNWDINGRKYISQCRESYVLSMIGEQAIKFYNEIGFGLPRKQKNISKVAGSFSLTPPIAHIIRRWMRAFNISKESLKRLGIYAKIWASTTSDSRITKSLLHRMLSLFPNCRNSDYELLQFMSRDDVRFEEVDEISDVSARVTYDFTVPDKGDFITNGFISHNTNGQGNWYHITWVDSTAKRNQFHPIEVNWWDMDWKIEYLDEHTKEKFNISPIANLRKCESKEEIDRYGPYWSPWLEEQYLGLQQRGEADKFRQEILAEFIGTGDTVLPREYLIHIDKCVDNNYKTIRMVDYLHPVSGDKIQLDFEDRLWVWKTPVRQAQPVIENGRIVRPGLPGHVYGIGIDISTGEGDDYSAIEVFDYTAREQVAELNIRVLPTILAMMADYIGRWYNTALLIPERTGLGAPVTQSIYYDLGYPNIFRMRSSDGKLSKKVGFPTTASHKPIIIKAMLDNLGNDGGFKLYSKRLSEQLGIFVHLGTGRTGSVKGPGNHDDLSIACGLSLVGMADALVSDSRNIIPTRHIPTEEISTPPMSDDNMKQLIGSGGIECMMPVILGSDAQQNDNSAMGELQRFQSQLGGISPGQHNPFVTKRKNIIQFPSNIRQR